MKRLCKSLLALLIVAAILPGCGALEREYLADLEISLENHSGSVVVREWRYLLGSGSEIYYKQEGAEMLLGTTTGGDNGYCPFADGKYTVVVENKELLISWRFKGDIWKEKRFEIPEK